MAKVYVVYKENQIEMAPGWIADYHSYCSYKIGVIEDEYQDLRVELAHINADVLPTDLARFSIFADAYGGTVKIRQGSTPADDFPQLGISEDPDAVKYVHTMTADEVAGAVSFNKYLFKRIIRDRYNQKFKELNKWSSDLEAATWEQQKKEADAWTADNTATTPMLTTMATARGISVSDLVTKINTKVTAYNSALATLLGEQKDLEDDVDALADIAACHKWRHEKLAIGCTAQQLEDDTSISAPPTRITF